MQVTASRSLKMPPSTAQSRNMIFLVVGQSDSTNLSGFFSCQRERLWVEGP